MINNIDLAKRYDELVSERQPYIDRAIYCSKLTIPSLFPPEGQESYDFHIPNQGLGSRAVKNLGNKLLLSLLPPNTPFFQLSISDNEVSAGTEGKIEEVLSSIESDITEDLELRQFRPVLSNAVKQLLVTGNYLLYCGGEIAKGFRLNRYVIRRDGLGRVSEIIIKESITEDQIPESIFDQVVQEYGNERLRNNEEYDQYTHLYRDDDQYRVEQFINDIPIPETQSQYDLDACPYLALRMIPQDDEDYGRSYVEEHIGDMNALERLSRAIADGAVEAAKVLYLVEPNSTISTRAFAKTQSGDVLKGKATDISAFRLDKYADFRVAKEEADSIRRDLSAAFLMNTSVTRQAERVTAEEIRLLASELEQTLGGVYTNLALEFQLPIVKIMLAEYLAKLKQPALQGKLKPHIITGVQSLGRLQEIEKIRALIALLEPFGPDIISQYLHIDEFIARAAAALYLDKDDLIITPEERQQLQESLQAEQLTQQAAQHVMPELMKT